MKNLKSHTSLLLYALVMTSFSSASTPPSPEVARAQVYFVIDGGEQTLSDAKEKEHRLQISTYANENLMGTLKRRGMHAVPLKKQEDFTAGPDKYLLTTKITRYIAHKIDETIADSIVRTLTNSANK